VARREGDSRSGGITGLALMKQNLREKGLGLFCQAGGLALRAQCIVPQPAVLDFLLKHSLYCLGQQPFVHEVDVAAGWI